MHSLAVVAGLAILAGCSSSKTRTPTDVHSGARPLKTQALRGEPSEPPPATPSPASTAGARNGSTRTWWEAHGDAQPGIEGGSTEEPRRNPWLNAPPAELANCIPPWGALLVGPNGEFALSRRDELSGVPPGFREATPSEASRLCKENGPEAFQLPKAPFPPSVAGFGWEMTAATAAARCKGAGGVWTVIPNKASSIHRLVAVCSVQPVAIDVPGLPMLSFCSNGSLCEISLVSAGAQFDSMRGRLEHKYGPPRHHESRAAECKQAASSPGLLAFIERHTWRWGGAGGQTAQLQVQRTCEGDTLVFYTSPVGWQARLLEHEQKKRNW